MGRAIGIANAIGFRVGTKVNYTEDLKIYIDGLVTPLSSAQKNTLNTFYKSLHTGLGITSLTEAFDFLLITGNETAEAGLRNLVKRAHDATAVNSPVFTQFEGFKGNRAGGAYIDLNYNPTTDAVNVKLNDASYGVYTMQNPAEGDEIEMGDVNSRTIIYSKVTGAQYYRVNTNGYSNAVVDDRVGLSVAVRRNNTNQALYRNNVQLIDAAFGSETLPGAMRLLTATTQYSNNQISIAFAGRAFTDGELTVIWNAISDYLNTVFF